MQFYTSGTRTAYHTTPVSPAAPVAQKIRGFADLEPGWNFGEGLPLDNSVLEDAISLNAFAVDQGFVDTDAFPGPNGEVLLAIYHRRHYLEFIIEPDRSITFSREESGTELLYQEDLTLEEAKTLISEFSEEVWTSSAYSTGSTTIARVFTASQALLSAPRVATAGSPSSAPSAFPNQVGQFVNIYGHTIQQSPTPDPCSGDSPLTYCPTATS